MTEALSGTMSFLDPRRGKKIEDEEPAEAAKYASREHESETSGERNHALVELAKKLDRLVLGWAHPSRPKEERS